MRAADWSRGQYARSGPYMEAACRNHWRCHNCWRRNKSGRTICENCGRIPTEHVSKPQAAEGADRSNKGKGNGKGFGRVGRAPAPRSLGAYAEQQERNREVDTQLARAKEGNAELKKKLAVENAANMEECRVNKNKWL